MNNPLGTDNVFIARTDIKHPPVVASPKLRAAFAEARTAASLALLRAMAWSACAEDGNADYNIVNADVLRAVRQLGLPQTEAQVSSEVRSVADICCSSPPGVATAGRKEEAVVVPRGDAL